MGPYFAREKWSGSAKIEAGLKTALAKAPKATVDLVKAQLAKHKVALAGLPTGTAAAANEANTPIKIPEPKGDPKKFNITLGDKVATARALKAKGNVARGKTLFTSQACVSCHTTADGQTPKGPHLVDIGKRYKKAELIESILKPSAKIAQGFDTYVFVLKNGKAMTGFVTSESAGEVELRQINGISSTIKKSEVGVRRKSPGSVMPVGLVNSLTPEQLADLIAYLQSLK